MLKTKEETFLKEGVGVCIGRFQVDELTDGHQELIASVIERSEMTIVIVGLAPVKCTTRNPLDFESRRRMIQHQYPDVKILYIKDVNNDEIWSKTLDEMVRDNIPPNTKVTAYGSRDSFINHYNGFMTCKEFIPSRVINATERRKQLSYNVENSRDWRKGVIWATGNRYATAFSAVDIAIFDDEYEKILLGRKPGEDQFRLIGGFVDPDNKYGEPGALERNARREVYEESNVEISDPMYVCSTFVNDWRYRSENDKIMSLLFASKYVCGRATPGDDICELKWFDINGIEDSVINASIKKEITDVHKPLLDSLIKWVYNIKK